MSETGISEDDCSKIKNLYYDERHSLRELAERFNCEKDVIRSHLRYECSHEKDSPDMSQLKQKLEERAEVPEATEYETTTTERNTPSEFRPLVLRLYRNECLITSVDKPDLLEVAHVLSWSEHPDYRHDVDNVMVLNKLHHAAFDSGMFTLSQNYRLRVSPDFETNSKFLRQTVIEKEGEKIEFPEGATIEQDYLKNHNEKLDWWD